MKHLERAQWPPPGANIPVAQLRMNPKRLTRKYGMHFYDDHDDLDAMQLAVTVVNGKQYWFSRHDHQPGHGTIVHTQTSRETLDDDIEQLLVAMSLTRHSLKWRLTPDKLAPHEET